MSDFNEKDHPRDKDGKFVDKAGSSKASDKNGDAKAKAQKVADKIKFSRIDHFGRPIGDTPAETKRANEIVGDETLEYLRNKYPNDFKAKKALSIKEQVSATKEIWDKTESIGISIDYESTKQNRIRQVKNMLEKTDGFVERSDIGKIQVGDRIKKGLAYLNTDLEKACILAVPKVLEKGVIINKKNDHKGRGYSTITIANKVYFDDKHNGVMAVVVMYTNGHNYKVHRVLTLDGHDLTI